MPIHYILGSVWIELILLKLKTKNWKHCSKIIFKYVNSTVGPIFNEKIAEKWNLWVHEQCTYALFTREKSTFAATVQWTVAAFLQNVWKQKKKKKEQKEQKCSLLQTQTQFQWIQTDTYILYFSFVCLTSDKSLTTHVNIIQKFKLYLFCFLI